MTRDKEARQAQAIGTSLGKVLGNVSFENETRLVARFRGELPADLAGYAGEMSVLRMVTVGLAALRYIDDPIVREDVLNEWSRRLEGGVSDGCPAWLEEYRGLYRTRKGEYMAVYLSARMEPFESVVARLAEVFGRIVPGGYTIPPAAAVDPRDLEVGEAVVKEAFSSVKWICDESRATTLDLFRLKAPASVVVCILAVGLMLAVYASYVMGMEVIPKYFPDRDIPPILWLVLGIPLTFYVMVRHGNWWPFAIWVLSLSLLATASWLGLKDSGKVE